MTIIFLARHGESDWNVEKRFQGHSDRPLTERGREQAHALADLVASEKIEAIYTSPLSRARETAEIVAARAALEPLALPELREVDTGSWSGLSRVDVEARFPDGFARWRSGGSGWEDGETYEEMGERVIRATRRGRALLCGGASSPGIGWEFGQRIERLAARRAARAGGCEVGKTSRI